MKPLVLLHGALGCASQLEMLVPLLEPLYSVHVFEFYGHGKRSEDPQPLKIEDMAQELERYLKKEGIQEPFLFGYSMGGYVALYLESRNPGKFSKIACLGTKFEWNPLTASKEANQLNPEVLVESFPAFARELESRHGLFWKSLLEKTATMMNALGNHPVLTEKELLNIQIPCRIFLGEKDRMVSIEESTWAVSKLTNGKLEVLPDTPHPLERVDSHMLARQLRSFFSEEA